MQARGNDDYGRERISKILLQIAPPVMLAQLIQALYNIVDSFFVGKYSDDALTALSVIYPLQLILIALAVGTGVGVNTYMARQYAYGHPEEAENAAATGTVLGVVTWALLSVLCTAIMRPFVLLGVVGFVFFPDLLIGLFSSNAQVHEIGKAAFPIIGSSFLPAAAGLMMPHFFQAIGRGITSSFLAVLRQLLCLVPLFWAFPFVGLRYTWIAFPLAETVSGGVGYILYYLQLRQWKRETPGTQA